MKFNMIYFEYKIHKMNKLHHNILPTKYEEIV